MLITLNGEKRDLPHGTTVLGLLELLKIQQQRVAVELNEHIVKKDAYAGTTIQEGDTLEVVSFMQGGNQVQSSGCTVHRTKQCEGVYQHE